MSGQYLTINVILENGMLAAMSYCANNKTHKTKMN